MNPTVKNDNEVEIHWNNPDEKDLTELLVQQKGFAQGRVDEAIIKLKKLKDSSKEFDLEKPTVMRKVTDENSDKKMKSKIQPKRKKG